MNTNSGSKSRSTLACLSRITTVTYSANSTTHPTTITRILFPSSSSVLASGNRKASALMARHSNVKNAIVLRKYMMVTSNSSTFCGSHTSVAVATEMPNTLLALKTAVCTLSRRSDQVDVAIWFRSTKNGP